MLIGRVLDFQLQAGGSLGIRAVYCIKCVIGVNVECTVHLVNCQQVAQGIIWVWGNAGPDAGLESALAPLPLIPELDDTEGLKEGRVIATPLSVRDVPYGWDTMMENIVVCDAFSFLLLLEWNTGFR